MGMPLHNITIETLTVDDLSWFVNVAAVKMLTDEVKREELINISNIYKIVEQGMTTGTVLVAKSNGVCVGGIGGLLVPNLFNPTITTLVEIIWYVLPEYRRGRAGFMLLMAFDKLASEVADEVTLSVLDSSEVKIDSLEKRGFFLGELAFRKQY